ncbi:3-oxoacyl-[acyl-carrier protein] reductase [hydrothermal vent metagenome]|uniref:3-oxoacyl-[acyl-carrier protein] reductase n=1 Tax=hydrothermal vent metagenome TaxID=652676 RepID=A0A3B0Y714_9ZZZZ
MNSSIKALEQRIVLITGAAEGLGYELSLALAEQGATIIILDHQVPKLEKLYDTIVEAGFSEPAIYPMQLAGATQENFNELANTVQQTFGRLDGLIHNAAYLRSLTPLPNLALNVWNETIQVNLTAPFLLTQACLPMLKAAEKALLLFISDRVDTDNDNYAFRGAYGVSKAGLDELARTLKDEFEDSTGISVISHDPGPMLTSLRALIYPGQGANIPTAKEALAPILSLVNNSL